MWTCSTAKPKGTRQKTYRINKGRHTHRGPYCFLKHQGKFFEGQSHYLSGSNPLFAKAFSLCLGLHCKNQHNAALSKPWQNFPVQKRFTTANCLSLKKHPGGSSCFSPAAEMGVKKYKIDTTTSFNNPSAPFICKLHLYTRFKLNYFSLLQFSLFWFLFLWLFANPVCCKSTSELPQ